MDRESRCRPAPFQQVQDVERCRPAHLEMALQAQQDASKIQVQGCTFPAGAGCGEVQACTSGDGTAGQGGCIENPGAGLHLSSRCRMWRGVGLHIWRWQCRPRRMDRESRCMPAPFQQVQDVERCRPAHLEMAVQVQQDASKIQVQACTFPAGADVRQVVGRSAPSFFGEESSVVCTLNFHTL
eukprot:scaffold2497_cov348-Pavlova_lutheri.AAC.2